MNDATQATALQRLRRTLSLATLLRSIGALTMVGSLSVFLLHGFETQGDLNRVFMLLAQSALLASAGLFVGSALREPKGARVFLSLCLVSVPANFAVLGAMVFSIAPLDAGHVLEAYPGFARWEAASPAELGTAMAAGFVVLLPITFFAFAVMARAAFKRLSCGLIISSATLLIPIRDPSLMTIVAGLVVVAVFRLITNLCRERERAGRPATFEERLAQALLMLPPLIIIGRALMMNGVEPYSALALCIPLYLALRTLTRACPGTTRRQAGCAFLAGVAAAATALSATVLCATTLNSTALDTMLFPSVTATPIFAIVLGFLFHDLSRHVKSTDCKRSLGNAWIILVIMSLIPATSLARSYTDTIALLSIAVSIIVFGVITARPGRSVVGGIAALVILKPTLAGVFDLLMAFRWQALAVIGITTIVLGSLLERYGPVSLVKRPPAKDLA